MNVPHIIANRFRIEREIGRGGMGTVYRATHLGLERPIAIKILKPEFAADPEVVDRFMREARTMARLRHARAAIIFDAGKLADNRPFIVMEHVEGRTLAEHLADEKRFAPEKAVRIACEICEVLAEAHRVGIVHRDLKPSNIMLNERGVCVLDFGIAKVLAASADATRTHQTTESDVIIGTPRYMSPEQCMGNKVGPASDLYSLGVVLYEMLAGRPPFVEALPSAVLVKQATAAPPSILKLCADLSPRLAFAVHTLLAKNPAERPATAEAAGALLGASFRAQPARISSTMPPVASAPLAATMALLNARRPIMFHAGFATAMLVLLGTLLYARIPTSNAQAENSGTAGRGVAATSRSASTTKPSAQPSMLLLHPATAQRIASTLLRDPLADAHVVRLLGGPAIAALHRSHRTGTTYLCIMEQRGNGYKITQRTPLKAIKPRIENWTAEATDVDQDGYDEVLCTGTNSNGNDESRLVLYVPRTHQAYGLRVEPDRDLNSLRFVWSFSAATRTAAAYRPALRQRARSLVAAL